MPLNNAIKLQITNIIKNNSLNDIYYSDFQSIKKAARIKVNDNDILKYLSKKSIDELAKKESLSVSRFPKLIESILIIINYEPLEDETIEILNNLRLTANEYLQSNPKKNDELVEQKIKEFAEMMRTYNLERTIELEDISSTPSQTEEKIELLEKLKQLQDTKEALEQKIEKLEKNYSRAQKAIEKLENKSARLERDKKELQVQSHSLHEKVKSQEQQTNNLEMEKQSLHQENQHLNITLENQIGQLTKLSNKLKSLEAQEKKQQKEQKISQEIQEIIFQSLLSAPCSLADLTKHLAKKGFALSSNDIYKYLNIVKANIANIKGPSFEQVPPLYMIDKEPLSITTPFYLSIPSNELLEILCISDLHITSSEDLRNITYLMDKVYNYAALNNIPYIVNLGNTIEYPINYPLPNYSLEDVKKIETFLETISHDLPHDQNIYQLFLGGNTDKALLQLGVDPLNKLNQYCPDYINLGYDHASMKFGKDFAQYLTFHYLKQYSPDESTKKPFSIVDYINSYYGTKLKDKKILISN